jgi:phosphoinositide-3-kinase regulatory subunit 4
MTQRLSEPTLAGRLSLWYVPWVPVHQSLLTIKVESVSSITPQNSTFIPEYLLPQMRHLSTDPDIFVRTTYARGLVRLADAAVNMLEMSQAAKVPKSELEASGIVEVSDALSN